MPLGKFICSWWWWQSRTLAGPLKQYRSALDGGNNTAAFSLSLLHKSWCMMPNLGGSERKVAFQWSWRMLAWERGLLVVFWRFWEEPFTLMTYQPFLYCPTFCTSLLIFTTAIFFWFADERFTCASPIFLQPQYARNLQHARVIWVSNADDYLKLTANHTECLLCPTTLIKCPVSKER